MRPPPDRPDSLPSPRCSSPVAAESRARRRCRPGPRSSRSATASTYGTGATPETSYPAFLAATTGWTVVNGGVPGDTAQQGCERMPALVARASAGAYPRVSRRQRHPAPAERQRDHRRTRRMRAQRAGRRQAARIAGRAVVRHHRIRRRTAVRGVRGRPGRSRGSARDSASCCATMRCAPTRSTSTPTAIARSPRTSRSELRRLGYLAQ